MDDLLIGLSFPESRAREFQSLKRNIKSCGRTTDITATTDVSSSLSD